ncbi:MAG: YhdP family protein [Usitatibacter sp.]
MKALPRFLLRLAAGAAALAFVAFAALVLWLRYVALPNVDGYRADIVSSIEKASGMRVSAKAIRGGWGGLRPVISAEGVEVSDRRGNPAFRLQRAEVSLSWWSLALGQIRFHDVDFYRPDLVLRRGADGLIYLADKPLNAASPDDDGKFTEWLLSQPRVGIHGATLTWRDDFLGAPEVRLTGVEIAVSKHLGRHRAALTAEPPAQLAHRIDVRADVVMSRRDNQWRAAGELYAESLNADLGRLRDHLPVPETLRSGVGSLRVWAQFSTDSVKELIADLNMRDARAQLAADVLPLELATVAGRATYRARPDGFTLATEGLRFRLASGMEVQPGNFSLTRAAQEGKVPRIEVRADGIDLKIAAALVDYFPVPRDVKGQLLRFAPRGRIADAAIAWTEDGAKAYSIKGRFEDLGVNAVDALPGVAGITGNIEGTEAGGALRIASKNAIVELGHVFRAPLAFDALEVQAQWKHAGRALEVVIDEAHFANADLDGTLAGTWRSLPDAKEKSPGFLDVKGTLSRALVSRAASYVPNRIANTRDWLERSIQEGEIPRATFELKGDLWEFPFGRDSQGRYVFEAEVRKARLRYHPDWPSVDGIDGTVRFENRRMEIHSERATIFASRVKTASAVIEDLTAKPPVLVLDLDIDTTGADSVRFLRESPLVNGPGAFTRAVAIEGPARFKYRMEYPLWGTEPARIAGDYLFAGATASVGRMLAMRDVKGRLSFTERGVRAPDITGTLFGRPATLAMSTESDGRVSTTIEGTIDATALAEYVAAPIVARITGTTGWKARVLSGRQGTELTVATDLKGLAVTLPEPLAKGADSSRTLTLQIERLGTESEMTTATLDGGVHGRFSRAAGTERWQVALKAGGPVIDEPMREGLWIYGEVPRLDVDAWLNVFALARRDDGPAATTAERPAGMELRGVDLRMGRMHYLGREFAQMQARLERDAAQWSGKLASPLVAGEVQWNPEGKGRVFARLERLAIPESTAQPPQDREAANADLPALDVTSERFDFRGRTLGKLDLKAEPAGDEWRIDRLDITTGHAQFKSSGVWRRTAQGSITTLNMRLDVANLNALFNQFGYGDYLKRGSGQLEGTLVWPGLPSEFALANISGTLTVDARGGQFARIEPGAGKLLGLVSLQSLPRRALFDFRDVFSEGFAFERIHGGVKVAHGVLLTDGFEISGPSAFVSLAGEVSLPLETQALTLRVVPEVGEGMALAATVFGTPVLGLSTLLVSKLLKNPIGKAVAYEYQVSGSWDNPIVTRTSAPPAKAAAAAPADATQPALP